MGTALGLAALVPVSIIVACLLIDRYKFKKGDIMGTPTVYEVYFEGRKGVVIMSAFTIRELEKNITKILDERSLTFKSNEETQTVFFTVGDELIGFYREA